MTTNNKQNSFHDVEHKVVSHYYRPPYTVVRVATNKFNEVGNGTGFSKCHPAYDICNKDIGYKIALGRALKDLSRNISLLRK